MIHFDESDIENTFLRPCHCQTDEEDLERFYCYVEGTNQDKIFSDTINELTENVWYGIKPPRLFTKDMVPRITARQIYITRIVLDGKRTEVKDADEDTNKDSKVIVSMNKKKSAVRFLSQVNLE